MRLSGLTQIALILLGALVANTNCSNQNSITENVSSVTSDGVESSSTDAATLGTFRRTVGGPIPWTDAKQWIENYLIKRGASFSYPIKSTVLMEILSNPQVEGISLFHATDKNGVRHVLPIGRTVSGKLVVTPTVATKDAEISWQNAVEMISDYTGEVKSHFFGADAFGRLIKSQTDFVLVTSAIDYNDAEQALMSTEESSDGVWDKSNPCPPYCND